MNSVIGYDAIAYAQRQPGHSPDQIRDEVWNLFGQKIAGNVLDAGCGEGGWTRRLQQLNTIKRLVATDITDDGASKLPNIDFHIVDLASEQFPIEDGMLDWMFAIEVIEHLSNPRHFIKECYRCLKPGGNLVITTPCNDSLRAKLSLVVRGYYPAFCDHDYSGSGHITPILEIDLRRMSSEAGFAAINFFYNLPGTLPASSRYWQTFLPSLRGKFWTDTMIASLTK